jgi:hypothetical protein
MASKKSKLILQIMLGILFLSFVTACGGSGDKKETTDSTTMKMDTTILDTGGTRPVKPGE